MLKNDSDLLGQNTARNIQYDGDAANYQLGSPVVEVNENHYRPLPLPKIKKKKK